TPDLHHPAARRSVIHSPWSPDRPFNRCEESPGSAGLLDVAQCVVVGEVEPQRCQRVEALVDCPEVRPGTETLERHDSQPEVFTSQRILVADDLTVVLVDCL